MARLTLHAPSRLHFGLLSWGGNSAREFGGVGLMIDEPGLAITATPADAWAADGPLSARILAVAERAAVALSQQGEPVHPLRFSVEHAPPEHVGLGVGTQTALAVTRLIRESAGLGPITARDLAQLAGRGLRSAIGLHGFALGGLIVDGGRDRAAGSRPAPLLARLSFPPDWSILVVVPPTLAGLHGSREVQAFGQIPALPAATVDRLCRLVLLDLLPAVADHDLTTFGAALTEIQLRVGAGFAAAQGGIFAHPDHARLVESLEAAGLVGVGQSSWGPTLYGFIQGPPAAKTAVLQLIRDQTGWPAGSAFWTAASQEGARSHIT